MNVAQLKYEIDSSQAKTAKTNLGGMSKAAKDAENSQKGLGSTSTRAGREIVAANSNVARSSGLVTKAYSAMKIAVVAAIATMMAVLGRFVTSSISAASDLNETISKTATIFGDQSNAMLEWASGSAQAMGLSQQAALEAASTMGNMFSQLGAGRDVAGGISRDMIQLAADIASFNNVAGGAVAVSDAMQSAFRGEYDSLQRYIPTINAATVAQEALRMTGKANEKQLTALEKALAAQNLIMEGAGVAAGDFARTSGGLANQQRILAASLTDLSAKFGAAFTPVATLIVQGLNAAVSGLSAGLSFLGDNIDTIGVASATAGSIMLAYFGVSVLSPIAVAFGYVGAAGVAAIRAITAAMAANPLGALAVGIVAAVTALYVFRDEVQKAIGVDVIGIVKNAANMVIGSFVAAFEDIKFVWSNFGDIIGGAVMGGVNIVIAGVEKMVNAAVAGINKLIAAANSLPNWLKPESLENIAPIGDVSIERAANPAAGRLSGAVGARNAAVQSAMSYDYIGAIGGAFEASTPNVDAMNAALGEVEQSATGAGKALTDAAKTDPWKGLRKAVDTAKEGLDFAKGAAKGFLSDLRQGLANGEGLWQSFGKAALGVLDKILNKVEDELASAFANMLFPSSGSGGGGGFFGAIFGGLGRLLGFAKGTNYAPGGVAMVGEEGPELVELPRGSRVNTANETRRMMAPANQNGKGSSDVVTIVLQDDSGRMASIADQRINTASGTIVHVAVQKSESRILPVVADYQGNRAGSDFRTG